MQIWKYFWITHYTSNKQQFDGGKSDIFCLFVEDSYARFRVLRSICSIFTNQLFCKPFPQQEFEPPSLLYCLIHRKLHKNNGHSPFFLPPIMRSSVGQCRNIRFWQLYTSHVIITSAPEPKAPGELIVYRRQAPSSVNNFKRLLLWNYRADCNQISHTASRAFRKEKLFKWSGSHDQHGRHAHIW